MLRAKCNGKPGRAGYRVDIGRGPVVVRSPIGPGPDGRRRGRTHRRLLRSGPSTGPRPAGPPGAGCVASPARPGRAPPSGPGAVPPGGRLAGQRIGARGLPRGFTACGRQPTADRSVLTRGHDRSTRMPSGEPSPRWLPRRQDGDRRDRPDCLPRRKDNAAVGGREAGQARGYGQAQGKGVRWHVGVGGAICD